MSSKQDKLAAARKKLREFQGKQRENVINKKNNAPHNADAVFKDVTKQTPSPSPSSWTSESSHASSYFQDQSQGRDEFKIEKKLTGISDQSIDFPEYSADPLKITLPVHSQGVSGNSTVKVMSPAKSDIGDFIIDSVRVNESPVNHANGTFTGVERMTDGETGSFNTLGTSGPDRLNIGIDNLPKDTQVTMREIQTSNGNSNGNGTVVQDSITNPAGNEVKDFHWAINAGRKASNETEPQKQVMTELSVSQLVDENANLTEVLKRTQELLKYKTGEEQQLSEKVSFLQLKLKDLEGNLLSAGNTIWELKLANEELAKWKESHDSKLEEIKNKYESKVEEYSELQQKLELKTKECEYSNSKLQETQSQLSASLIKIQQLTIGESSALSTRVSELQNENASLAKRIKDLENNLECVNKEKEESSQSFQTYAQQCNAQLKSLSSEVRTLAKENRSLTQENKVLEKKLSDLQSEKTDLQDAMENVDLKSLNEEKNALKEENRGLELRLQEKIKTIEAMKNENEGKLDEINQLCDRVKGLESENLKLMEDRERTNRNEKLLAAMESDKVAAARAVSQNQKLKDQVCELEEGLIKLSNEKLQLADELAHERHVKKELELRLQALQSPESCDHDHHESSEKVTNDSSDLNELRRIIRQLEEDKTELISRLKSGNQTRTTDDNADRRIPEDDLQSVKSGDCEDPEQLKILLQQMEEKLKRTMNEIAVLDEEKEKLEHIVLQLQCETETIEEYISLYHNQRMLLKKRSREKDEQLMQLSKDKEELKAKLTTLNQLVNHLLQENGTESREMTGVSKIAVDNETKEHSEATAEKIQNLISEIQSTNLIDNQSMGFEHCSCCSGRLITV